MAKKGSFCASFFFLGSKLGIEYKTRQSEKIKVIDDLVVNIHILILNFNPPQDELENQDKVRLRNPLD
jgi:hypothetical protein